MKKPEEIKILIGCEESQAICKAFLARGFDTYSCDLKPCSGGMPERHLQGDVREIVREINPDCVILHPPCTFLCASSGCNLFNKDHSIKSRERYEKGVEAREFFLECVEIAKSVKYGAVENPLPLKIYHLPPYSIRTSPHYFGADVQKRTCFWLFNLPPLIPSNVNNVAIPMLQSKFFSHNSKNRQEKRSKTHPALAIAIAEQWGNYILEKENET